MKNASELTTAIDASPRDIENWVARLELSTKFAETTQGKARLYSKMNAYELGFIAGLVRGGASPSRAAVFARSLVRALKPPVYSPPKEWFVFAAGELTKGKSTDRPDVIALQKEMNATTLSFVHIGEIVRRVDKLFEEE